MYCRLNKQLTTASAVVVGSQQFAYANMQQISRNAEAFVNYFVPPFSFVANGLCLIIFWRLHNSKQQVCRDKFILRIFYSHVIHVVHY
jgi:hypothetical protein